MRSTGVPRFTNPLLVNTGPFFFNNNNNGNNWLFGYAVGGGVEWAFFNNLSIKAEYLYTDIRRTDNNNNFSNNNNNNALFRERNHIIRAGLNYRFNWGFGGYGGPAPVVARYCENGVLLPAHLRSAKLG
jgi:hypothetical protein